MGEGTALLSKPMIYVSLGTPAPDTDLSDMSAAVIDTNSWSDFSGTAEQIVSAQQDMVRLRTRNSNQYMIRYVVPERSGTHELVLTSNTSGFNYALTTLLDLTLAAPEPFAQPMVEISGPGDAYLVGDVVSLDDATRLFPNTRWTTQEYGAADYSWTVNGSARSKNADGSITLTSADAGATVVLTNNSLSFGTVSATVAVTKKYSRKNLLGQTEKYGKTKGKEKKRMRKV